LKIRNRSEGWEDTETALWASTKTELAASVKRFKLGIPDHEFLSNRFVLYNVKWIKEDAQPSQEIQDGKRG
jgi:hypothetical protein